MKISSKMAFENFKNFISFHETFKTKFSTHISNHTTHCDVATQCDDYEINHITDEWPLVKSGLDWRQNEVTTPAIPLSQHNQREQHRRRTHVHSHGRTNKRSHYRSPARPGGHYGQQTAYCRDAQTMCERDAANATRTCNEHNLSPQPREISVLTDHANRRNPPADTYDKRYATDGQQTYAEIAPGLAQNPQQNTRICRQ